MPRWHRTWRPGLRIAIVGALANAKVLEDMAKVWLTLTQAHGRGIGFALSLG